MADRDRPAALKSLRKLGRKDRERVTSAMREFPDGDAKRLRGPQRLWRLRVGEWRIIFDRRASERVIDVLAIRPSRPRLSVSDGGPSLHTRRAHRRVRAAWRTRWSRSATVVARRAASA